MGGCKWRTDKKMLLKYPEKPQKHVHVQEELPRMTNFAYFMAFQGRFHISDYARKKSGCILGGLGGRDVYNVKLAVLRPRKKNKKWAKMTKFGQIWVKFLVFWRGKLFGPGKKCLYIIYTPASGSK